MRRVSNCKNSIRQSGGFKIKFIGMAKRLLFFSILFLSAQTFGGTRFYYELGAGVSQVRQATPFFGDSAPTNLSFGTAIVFGFGLDFGSNESVMNFHFGVSERYTTGSKDSVFYSMHAPYAYVRLDGKKLFLTVGAAPLVWQRIGSTAGIDAFKKVSGAIGLLGELGFSFPITPIVNFEFITGSEIVLKGGSISPKPTLELLGCLRVYMGGRTLFEKERKYYGAGGPGEYDGWRYPYGFDQRH